MKRCIICGAENAIGPHFPSNNYRFLGSGHRKGHTEDFT